MPDAGRRHDQRAFRGIADRAIHARLALVALENGVVAQRAGDQQQVEVRLHGRRPRGVGLRSTARQSPLRSGRCANCTRPAAMSSAVTVMRFWVSVPVLSEQIT